MYKLFLSENARKGLFCFAYVCFLTHGGLVSAQQPVLLPLPQKMIRTEGVFSAREAVVSTQGRPLPALDACLNELGIRPNSESPDKIEIMWVNEIDGVPVNPEEAYQLLVSPHNITIRAVTERGAYWALKTLGQLASREAENYVIPGCVITDWPAFRLRGFMQDVARAYISVDELKREIKALSDYKMNVFHWHLTDFEAWRLESKAFPELTDPNTMTRMPGKYYTIEEAKELARYCREQNVILIPEIDMPGHSTAFTKAFHHDMQSPEGMQILKLLLDEICDVFKEEPYLHIGTDEVEFTNLAFVPEMVDYIRQKGKKVISWNPGWTYEPGEIDLTHLWSYWGKAQPGIPAIDSRFTYLNHFDTFADLIGLYTSRIYDEDQGSPDLAGTALAVWSDRLVQPEDKLIRENNLYPNLLAIAERSWLGGGYQYFDQNGTMLPLDPENEVHRAFTDFEQRLLWHKENRFQGYPFPYVKQTHLRWRITDAFPNEGVLTEHFPPEDSLRTHYLYKGKTYETHDAIGAGIYLRHVWGEWVRAFYEHPQENHTAYAWTWIYSPEAQDVGAWIEFQNYARSDRDLPPLPGKWDYKESHIWINDEEIAPPEWTATHRELSYDISLGNENCTGREPLPIHLGKGWNKVFLKLPVGKFTTPEVRLITWMFTFICVTPDGEKAVDNLIYSPDKVFNAANNSSAACAASPPA